MEWADAGELLAFGALVLALAVATSLSLKKAAEEEDFE